MAKMKDVVPLIITSLDKGMTFELPVKGTSMLPLFNENDTTVILAKSGVFRKNDIVLYKREDGRFVLHRIYKKKSTNCTMLGDHQTSLEKGVLENQIICKVKEYRRNNKTYSLTNFKYKVYVFLWHSRLLRKVYFKVKK